MSYLTFTILMHINIEYQVTASPMFEPCFQLPTIAATFSYMCKALAYSSGANTLMVCNKEIRRSFFMLVFPRIQTSKCFVSGFSFCSLFQLHFNGFVFF